MEKTQIIAKTKKSYFNSVAFLTFIILVTIWLFFYNKHLIKVSKSLENTISEYSKSIESYKNDKNFIIYSLIEVNKKNLEILENNSKITKFIDHLDYIKNLYDIEFRWFNFTSWRLWTSIMINSDDYTNIDYKLAYQKLSKFIWSYREDVNSMFDLDFVNQISWHDQMKLKVNFTVKK